MKAKPEDMLVLWEQYSQFKEVKTEDVRRIIRIVTAREKERLLQGSYAFKVVHLIVDAILWRREGEIQKMVAKLLLTMFSFIQDEEDTQSVKQTLKCEYKGPASPIPVLIFAILFLLQVICVAEFTLAEDVIFACQSALFSLGEERKEASLIMLAGHEVFYKAPVNVAKAYQYVLFSVERRLFCTIFSFFLSPNLLIERLDGCTLKWVVQKTHSKLFELYQSTSTKQAQSRLVYASFTFDRVKRHSPLKASKHY